MRARRQHIRLVALSHGASHPNTHCTFFCIFSTQLVSVLVGRKGRKPVVFHGVVVIEFNFRCISGTSKFNSWYGTSLKITHTTHIIKQNACSSYRYRPISHFTNQDLTTHTHTVGQTVCLQLHTTTANQPVEKELTMDNKQSER